MTLKKRQAPKLVTTPVETCWIDDDAIDADASDAKKWATTGTMDGVVTLAGQKPGRIRYRALTEPELDVLPPDGGDEALLARFYAAAAVGLVSVEGEHIDRERRSNAWRITDSCVSRLCEYHAPIHWNAVLHAYFASIGVDIPLDEKDAERRADVSLPAWVGVHVLAASFRARRGAV